MCLFLDGGRKANYQEEKGQAEEKVVPVPVNTACFSPTVYDSLHVNFDPSIQESIL